jgi:hypothetical protein
MSEQRPGQCDCGDFHGREGCPWDDRPYREDDDSWQAYDLFDGFSVISDADPGL